MYMVSIDEALCSGCQECTAGCPAHLLKCVGDKTEVVGDPCECIGCESCVAVCPTGAVTVSEI